MRAAGPVTPVVLPHGDRVWLVARYADVRAALADPRRPNSLIHGLETLPVRFA